MHTRRTPARSSVTSRETDIVTRDDSNDPTIPYGFGIQQPIIPPSLRDLHLPSNPFNTLATMAVVQADPTQREENYSPQSLEPSESTPISTPPLNLSTIEGWETPHTSTDNATFKRRMSFKKFIRTFLLMKHFVPRTSREEFILNTVPPLQRHTARWRGDLALDCLFRKEGECCRMSSKSAERCFLQQRTFLVRRQEFESLQNTENFSYII